MGQQIILEDLPLVVATPEIPIEALTALNAAWMHNALLLGKICLVVGFIIGAVSVYFYMRGKYAE